MCPAPSHISGHSATHLRLAPVAAHGGGWLVLLWGILLLPIGFGIQAVALLRSRAIPRWQSILFLIGVLFVGTPDGAEVINLTAAILLAVAFVPYATNA